MHHYCIIGWPLIHTDSPRLHHAAFQKAHIDGLYEAMPVPPGELEKFFQQFRSTYDGANVTIPHKEKVLKFLDRLSPEAKKIGAVNTIVKEGIELVGHNTDCFGARAALEASGAKISGSTVLLIGAGGAARAILYALTQEGARVFVWNRTFSRAQDLAREFGGTVLQNPVEHVVDIIINASPVGALPNANETPLPGYQFQPNQTVMDIVYHPQQTKMLENASAAGAKIITGDIMLRLQAQESFRLWTGKRIDFLSLIP